MRIWGVVIVTCFGAATASAEAEADPSSFEAMASSATPLSRVDLAGLSWALTAPCTDGDDVVQRQCRGVRDARARAVRATTYLVDADPAALTVGPWKPETRTAPVMVRGCVACTEPVGGLYIVASKAAPTWDGATLQAALLHETSRPFKDDAAARAWAARTGTLRTQLIVRVSAATGGLWDRDGKRGVAVDVLGFRVYDPCDGDVIVAAPASAKAPSDRKACGDRPAAPVASGTTAGTAEATPAAPELPTQLEAKDIKAVMRPVIDAATACFDTYGVAGSGKLIYTVSGNGSVMAYELTGDFADTPTGKCIDQAARAVTFPKVKKKKFGFTYPLVLQ